MLEPHNGGTGYTILIHRPGTSVTLASIITTPTKETHSPSIEPVSTISTINVGLRTDLDDWVTHLDQMGVAPRADHRPHRAVRVLHLVFRDPDNIQLELIWLGQG